MRLVGWVLIALSVVYGMDVVFFRGQFTRAVVNTASDIQYPLPSR